MAQRPELCRKRGCYIRPKSLWQDWDALNVRCPDCPYGENEMTEEVDPLEPADARPALLTDNEILEHILLDSLEPVMMALAEQDQADATEKLSIAVKKLRDICLKAYEMGHNDALADVLMGRKELNANQTKEVEP